MISVETALEKLFELVKPMTAETVPIREANGRVLAKDVVASRDQPPFSTTAMDGYAIANSEINDGDFFTVIGEAAAGHRFDGVLETGEAVRIFTGAPLPLNTKRIVIQEDVKRSGNNIIVLSGSDESDYIRPPASDFPAGYKVIGGRKLKPADIALLASMNNVSVAVIKRPIVAIITTGDELVMPGEKPNEDQIVASNTFGLAALLENNGAIARILPVARDRISSLKAVFDLCAGADLVVTIGGASVGDHDLVASAAAEKGLSQIFYKVAMRPGKPLMAGQLGKTAMVGLPGNPVSSLVCGYIFLIPMIKSMLGFKKVAPETFQTVLLNDLPANSVRKHFCRAKLSSKGLYVNKRQDSSLLTVLADANALAIREPNAPKAKAGDTIEYMRI